MQSFRQTLGKTIRLIIPPRFHLRLMQRHRNNPIAPCKFRTRKFAAHEFTDHLSDVFTAFVFQSVNHPLHLLPFAEIIIRRCCMHRHLPPKMFLHRIPLQQMKPRPRQMKPTLRTNHLLPLKQRLRTRRTQRRIKHPRQVVEGGVEKFFHVQISGLAMCIATAYMRRN